MSRAPADHLEPRFPPGGSSGSGHISMVVELSKPGIVKMVTFSSCVGYFMAAAGSPDWTLRTAAVSMTACVIGTALSAAGANALNQVMEVDRDGLMKRTMHRPLPSARMDHATALFVGVVMSILGLGVLCLFCNAWASLVSAATIVSYLFCYTPLKPVTTFSTIIGAVPGALPPLIGWAAATQIGPGHSKGGLEGARCAGLLEPGGWTIFALMFAWQVPHFLAIAWKYRDEYAAAGHKVLPSSDPDGSRTGRSSIAWSLALIPVSLAAVPAMPDRLGIVYCAIATLAGAWMVSASMKLYRERSDAAARKLFIVSIFYLPLALTGMG